MWNPDVNPIRENITVVIPAYNEEEAIQPVIKEIPDIVNEIIVVDDGSTDRTYELAKQAGATVYKHETNKGKVGAIRTGVANAQEGIIILTDADCTYPAKIIPDMIKEMENGAQLVIGSRFKNGVENVPLFNRIGNKIFSITACYISGQEITDAQSGFRAFNKDFLDILGVSARGLEFETEMTVKAAKHGYKMVEIPINYRKRVGTSKLNPIKDGYKMGFALMRILIKETSMLAKVIMIPGGIVTFIGLVFGVISFHDFIQNGAPRPFYPLITTLAMLIGIQLFSLGLIIDNMSKKILRIDEKLDRSLKRMP